MTKIKNRCLKDGIEWEDYDLITECEHCWQVRPCVLIADPYISEVCPEDKPKSSYWCFDCFSGRKDDV